MHTYYMEKIEEKKECSEEDEGQKHRWIIFETKNIFMIVVMRSRESIVKCVCVNRKINGENT